MLTPSDLNLPKSSTFWMPGQFEVAAKLTASTKYAFFLVNGLVLRRVRSKLKLVQAVRRGISEGVIKRERVLIICPACGQQVEAVATDGRVKGYCAVAMQRVNFLIEAQRVPIGEHRTAETRAKISAASKKRWQDPEYRAKMATASKKLWQDPEYRAKVTAARTGKHPTGETTAKISVALTRRPYK